MSRKLDEGAQERSEISFETYTCYAWFQVRDKTGTKDLITTMIKAMGITIALTVIRATVAMGATTTLGTTIPTMDMGRDTRITAVSGFALAPDNKSNFALCQPMALKMRSLGVLLCVKPPSEAGVNACGICFSPHATSRPAKHIWESVPWRRQPPKQLPALLRQYLVPDKQVCTGAQAPL